MSAQGIWDNIRGVNNINIVLYKEGLCCAFIHVVLALIIKYKFQMEMASYYQNLS